MIAFTRIERFAFLDSSNPHKLDVPKERALLLAHASDGRRWQTIEIDTEHFNTDGDIVHRWNVPVADYTAALRDFEETIRKVQRDLGYSSIQSSKNDIPNGCSRIDKPTQPTSPPHLLDDYFQNISQAANDDTSIFIILPDGEIGRIDVECGRVSWVSNDASHRSGFDSGDLSSPDLTIGLRAVGGDFAVSAVFDETRTIYVAFDLLNDVAMPANADYHRRRADLAAIIDDLEDIELAQCVSDPEAKRSVAHDYEKGRISRLIVRTPSPLPIPPDQQTIYPPS